MLLSALALLAALAPQIDARVAAALPPVAGPVVAAAAAEPPRYDPAARAVSNWRAETGAHLLPRALALTASLSDDPPYVARCVRLNNGWCIKSARWSGEIGADAEGHTAFASLGDGADAAALLLRRYYRDYGRRSALAVVRRWAPAACGPVVAAPSARGASLMTAALAPRGIGRTLRARYLARHRPGGAPRAAALRVQPWSPLARMAGRPGARSVPSRPQRVAALRPAPDIAADIGPAGTSASRAPVTGADARPAPEPAGRLGIQAGRTAAGRGPGPRPPRRRPVDDPAAFLDAGRTAGGVPSPERLLAESALLPAIAAGLPHLDLRLPVPVCAGDEARIRAYAARIAGSVGVGPEDDLALFGPDGVPLANLAPVMMAMSAVELGTLRAGPALVEAAVGRLVPAASPASPAGEGAAEGAVGEAGTAPQGTASEASSEAQPQALR